MLGGLDDLRSVILAKQRGIFGEKDWLAERGGIRISGALRLAQSNVSDLGRQRDRAISAQRESRGIDTSNPAHAASLVPLNGNSSAELRHNSKISRTYL